MQLYNVATQTEIGIDLPRVVYKKHQTGDGECHQRSFSKTLSKSL